MGETLSIRTINALRQGKAQLGEEAQQRIQAYICSQQLEDGSFMDKNGCSDVYYTTFGWLLCYVFGLTIPRAAARNYLNKLSTENLDLVHYAAYMRCQLLYRLLTQPNPVSNWLFFKWPHLLSAFNPFTRVVNDSFSTPFDLGTVRGYPHDDAGSPYSLFLRLSLLEDVGKRLQNPKVCLQTLRAYRTPDGGYSNQKANTGNGTGFCTNKPTNAGTETTTATTVNATAAALCVLGQLKSPEAGTTADFLLSRQHNSGGFAASTDAPLPDLLSTATALFALNANRRKPNSAARDFIEAHWNEHTGGFSATLFDESSDIEYTFYGLLALGTL